MSYSRRRRNGRNQSTNAPITSIATKALAAYGAFKLASWAWNKFNTKDDDEQDYETSNMNTSFSDTLNHRVQHHHSSKAFSRRRQLQLRKCNQETISVLDTFLNTLRSTIETLTDFSPQTRMLKEMKKSKDGGSESESNHNGGDDGDKDGDSDRGTGTGTDTGTGNPSKQKLWDEIKTKSVTRMISTVYAHSILNLILTVQINLLGGRIFREQLHVRGELGDTHEEGEIISTNGQADGSSHKEVLLKTYEYFFHEGLNALVSDVEMVVQMNLPDWKVIKDDAESLGSISMDQFDDRMQCIRKILDRMTIEQYICGDDFKSQQTDDVQFIFEETLDLLESPVFETAKRDVIDATFHVLKEHGYGTLFGGEEDKAVPVPLAGVVTKLKKITNSFYASPDESAEDTWVDKPMSSYPNVYLYHLDRIDSVKELSDVSFN